MVNLFKKLYSELNKKRKFQLFLLLILMIFASFAEIISIGSVIPFLGVLASPETVYNHSFARPFIELIDIESPEQLILPVTVFFTISILLSNLIRLLLVWYQSRLGYAIGADISLKIFKRTLFQTYQSIINHNSSELISGISKKANNAVSSSILPLMNIISSSLILFFILVILFFVNFQMTLISLISFFFMYMFIIIGGRKKLLDNSLTISSKSNELIKIVQESIGSIRDVIVNSNQSFFLDYFRRSDTEMRRAQSTNQIINESPKFFVEALGMILIAWVSYGFLVRGHNIETIFPMLGVLVLGAQKMVPLIQKSYSSWAQMRGEQQSLSDIVSLLCLPDFSYERNIKTKDSFKFTKKIRFENLCFSYFSEQRQVIKETNLDIFKGDCIGLYGKTGSGKSTLIDIIMGLLQPTSGSIFIDGKIINLENSCLLRSQVSHVPQRVFLLDASIAENIAFAINSDLIDYELIKEVSSQAKLLDFVNSLPEGFNTIVGENGVKLSGGQVQRIGISRALYNKNPILILDEATSALDSQTESQIIDSIIKNNKTTIIMIAHRLSTLKYCNKIFEMKSGRLVEKVFTEKDFSK